MLIVVRRPRGTRPKKGFGGFSAGFHCEGLRALVEFRIMAMYVCRWPNGDFSIVSAPTREDAVILLDEWGNAEQASLKRMPDCMFDFRLSNDGQIELSSIGEATDDFIMQTCYPELERAMRSAELDEKGSDFSAHGKKQIRAAVKLERARSWSKQPPAKKARTELGRQIQTRTGAPSALVDRIVEQAAKKQLDSMDSGGKKPN
jgi:hypothetical protein